MTARRTAFRTRLLQLTIAWAVVVVSTWCVATYVGRHPTPGGDGRGNVARSPIQVLASWDGTIYESIAQNGYQVSGEDRRLFVFFPLFPALSRLTGGRTHAALGGIVVSQLALLAAMFLLSYLTRDTNGKRLTDDPALWMLAAPMALFFQAMYSESLFVLLTIGAAVTFRQKRHAWTFVLAFLGGLTRPTAVTFCIPFLWAAASAWRRGERWWPALLCAAAPIAGIAIYVIAVGIMLGDPLAYPTLRATSWHYQLAIPFLTTFRDAYEMAYAVKHGQAVEVWQIARMWTVGITVVLLLWGWRRIEWPWLAYFAVSLAFIHASNPPGSSARYEVVLFPVFMLLALSPLAKPKVAPVFLALSFAAQMLLLVRFGQWVWVG
ncbi:MAG TPA: mannosyltransferase family protein [Gemmatimonadaceae bacterium]|nr:mannosyltransferase family protein [Gemmatimonadaceae bacterium]